MRRRGRREYALYELHLSPHDEAKPQDLEDMMEAIANVVRAFPAERARSGQPFLAFELLHGAGPSGALEWSLGVRCEPRVAVALDAAISAAYPDVRLGHRLGETPQPRDGSFREPPHVMRFTKQRSFVYPLVASGDELASPPLEAIAHAQVAAGAPSVIRFQLTPAPALFEGLARAVYRRHENRLVRQERWGLPEGGLTSTLNRAEMANAERDPEPQPALARGRRRRRHARDLQATRRRHPGAPRREPAAPPLDDRAREPLPPPLRHRHPSPAALAALAGLGGRGRAPARAARPRA